MIAPLAKFKTRYLVFNTLHIHEHNTELLLVVFYTPCLLYPHRHVLYACVTVTGVCAHAYTLLQNKCTSMHLEKDLIHNLNVYNIRNI